MRAQQVQRTMEQLGRRGADSRRLESLHVCRGQFEDSLILIQDDAEHPTEDDLLQEARQPVAPRRDAGVDVNVAILRRSQPGADEQADLTLLVPILDLRQTWHAKSAVAPAAFFFEQTRDPT